MIETDELCVSIGKKRIVDHSTIHVDEGEFVGLIGPNGSGKSTMLKAIYRTLEPESGTITVNGVMLKDSSLRESALNLAVVSQHNYYNFDFMVEEVVMMGRTPHKKSMEMDNEEDRRIVGESLEKVGMSDFKGRKFSSLSGGEQQRIILARALTQMSPCLVLDEPTNHLDVKYQLDVLDIVKGLGSTVLCALHDLNLAAQYCDRIYILEGGRVRYEGSPSEVITEDVILEIYGVKSSVEVHPKTGLLNVVYYPRHSSGF
ncbi:MAG: ABC transporter ATP-binding protein [Candidatus Methanomethylophilaceae archaeon]|nr:ABC transporter ATP-binding protein [Candidatus Methanomethylophilaceae archaeon]MBR7123669.1 ABC transporter ATP-binding protein [Candidatus Methanomethylophilaceae archaeon]